MRRSLLAAADWVAAGRDELNRLNVFPVPDGDTGTNLCLTLREVAQALRDLGDAPLPRVTDAMAQASVRGARGNSGMMLSQFLLGLREGLGDRLTAAARAGGERDLRVFMRRLVHRTEQALARTPELLAVLKSAGVVDAGAKGFVRLLDGVKRLIEDGHLAEGAVDRRVPDAAANTEVAAGRDFQFCTEVLVRGPSLPSSLEVREALRPLGG